MNGSLPCETGRVLLISFCPLDRIGGGEAYTLATVRALLSAGCDVALASPTTALPVSPGLHERQAASFIFTTFNTGQITSETLAWNELLPRIAEVDIVWVHQYQACDHVFDVVGAAACDQRVCFTSLGLEPRREVFARLFQPSDRHHFVEISDYAASRSKRFSRSAAGVPAAIWDHTIKPPTTARRRFCAIGRVLPHKGFEVSIAALPPGAGLDVVGPLASDSPYCAHLRRSTGAKDVVFHDAVAASERDDLTRNAVAVVASSTHRLFDGTMIEQPELLGLVLLESVALGTIPIASDIPSFREIMRQLGLVDWLYPERDDAALRSLMTRCRDLSPSDYARTIAPAQSLLRRHFLWDNYWSRVTQQWRSP